MKDLVSQPELAHFFGNLLSPQQTQRSLLLIHGILESKTVNLWSCAEALSRRPDIDLSAQQLYEQYLSHFQTGRYEVLLKAYFLAVFHLTHEYASPELVMDRTEWQLGSQWQNLLVIGYICHDSMVPLVWTDLGEKRASSTSDRFRLLDRLLKWWGLTGVPIPRLILYADREFIGAKWFRGLMKREIEFVIRLKGNLRFPLWRNERISETDYAVESIGPQLKACKLPSIDLVVGDELLVPLVYAEQVTWEDGKEVVKPWYLAAQIADVTSAAQRYARRWKIEDMFGALKSKGLNLEDYNLVGRHKLEIMFGLIAVINALCIHQSLREELVQARKLKKYRSGRSYPAKSSFKLGLERIRQLVHSLESLLEVILQGFRSFLRHCETKMFILNNSIVQ